MGCFLDTNAFGTLLGGVDRKKLPPEVLLESPLSPITALECALNNRNLRIMREHSDYLRPLRTRFIRDSEESFDDFVKGLPVRNRDYYKGLLSALHARCVMYPPFLAFHMSRYKNPPRGIAGSQRLTSDVRDSMQLIISQQMPFITCDRDLTKKLSPKMRCQIIYADPNLTCIVTAMRMVNSGMTTADNWQ